MSPIIILVLCVYFCVSLWLMYDVMVREELPIPIPENTMGLVLVVSALAVMGQPWNIPGLIRESVERRTSS